ncbi:hypothetical protein HDU93_008587 [Gonapodya sp. JEL0774]|nr:hypothetical protein HDU93_008587 [Gonapodya sp. JEL0774]
MAVGEGDETAGHLSVMAAGEGHESTGHNESPRFPILPFELLRPILAQLSTKDLFYVAPRVCRAWRSAAGTIVDAQGRVPFLVNISAFWLAFGKKGRSTVPVKVDKGNYLNPKVLVFDHPRALIAGGRQFVAVGRVVVHVSVKHIQNVSQALPSAIASTFPRSRMLEREVSWALHTVRLLGKGSGGRPWESTDVTTMAQLDDFFHTYRPTVFEIRGSGYVGTRKQLSLGRPFDWVKELTFSQPDAIPKLTGDVFDLAHHSFPNACRLHLVDFPTGGHHLTNVVMRAASMSFRSTIQALQLKRVFGTFNRTDNAFDLHFAFPNLKVLGEFSVYDLLSTTFAMWRIPLNRQARSPISDTVLELGPHGQDQLKFLPCLPHLKVLRCVGAEYALKSPQHALGFARFINHLLPDVNALHLFWVAYDSPASTHGDQDKLARQLNAADHILHECAALTFVFVLSGVKEYRSRLRKWASKSQQLSGKRVVVKEEWKLFDDEGET